MQGRVSLNATFRTKRVDLRIGISRCVMRRFCCKRRFCVLNSWPAFWIVGSQLSQSAALPFKELGGNPARESSSFSWSLRHFVETPRFLFPPLSSPKEKILACDMLCNESLILAKCPAKNSDCLSKMDAMLRSLKFELFLLVTKHPNLHLFMTLCKER